MWQKIEHSENGAELVKTFQFEDFIEAFSFCTKVAIVAEKSNHHPVIHIEYNIVTISTTTHDRGNVITEKDHNLTSKIDKLNT